MSSNSYTNYPSQWPPVALAWPGYAQYPTYPGYHNIPAMAVPDNGQPPTRPHPTRPRDNCQPQIQHTQRPQRVSQAKVSGLLDWLEYGNDNRNEQTHSGPQTNPYFHPQALFPASIFPAQQTFFDPQAATFQPTPSQRYNLRQRNDSQLRPYSTGTAQQFTQSDSHAWAGDHKKHWQPPRANRRTTPSRNSPRPNDVARPITPPPEPIVSAAYLEGSRRSPQRLSQPHKLLIILDLNGTLLARKPGERDRMLKRPGVASLLAYMFHNHTVMVCTSATKHNAHLMVEYLLTPQQKAKLVTIRARDTFNLNQKQYSAKTQIYKNLEDIWKDPLVKAAVPHGAQMWSMDSTVLIDDSMLKAKAQPHNLIQVPEFEWLDARPGSREHQKMQVVEEKVMKAVQKKLESLKWQDNVASQIREWQETAASSPGPTGQQVTEGAQSKTTSKVGEPGAEDYPTPTSLSSDSLTDDNEAEEEYEPPEQVELVFRGRNKDIAARSKEPQEPPEDSDKSPLKEMTSRRDASPVTVDHFSWMKKS